jgi:predicted nicotinamide N-methyase
MPGYATRCLTVHIGEHDYRLRALSDLNQFVDRDGAAERAGISSAQWSLFGYPWPSGCVLAETMSTFDVGGKRILELGCGLGLSSIVLQHRGADITASDHHPLASSFLEYNAALNGLAKITYRDLPWADVDEELGHFDLIIGSDILYERGHAALVSDLIAQHACAGSEVLITDPGRGNSGSFSRAMESQGYTVSEQRSRFEEHEIAPFRGRLLSYSRTDPDVEGARA